MARTYITYNQWRLLVEKLKTIQFKFHSKNLKKFFEALVYKFRTGIPWRDIPRKFGHYKSIHSKFRYWVNNKIFVQIFKASQKEPDLEWLQLDGTLVKAHQHSTGYPDIDKRKMGKTVGGNNSKIHAVVDSFGMPLNFIITSGEKHDSTEAINLIDKIENYNYVIADKAYHSYEIREFIKHNGAIPVIPKKSNSINFNEEEFDKVIYKERHKVENFFCKIKHFRGIATRYDKNFENYEAGLHLISTLFWLKF